MTDRRDPTGRAKQEPTSYPQEGLWFLDRLAPGSPACHAYRCFRVTGELDVPALRAAWREVVRRHEILRTRVVAVDGRPVQRIAAGHAAPGSFVHVPQAAAAGEHPRPAASPTAGAGAPFDLAAGPLARIVVTRLAPAEHRVLLAAHCAVADERSLSIVVDELSELYGAAVRGQPVRRALPPPELQYAGYARAQRHQPGTERDRRLRDWWTSSLSTPPAPLDLPSARPRPAGPSRAGGTVHFHWGDGLSGRLLRLAAAERVPPPAVVLAGMQALLYRYSGDDQPAVGVPVPVAPAGSAGSGVVGPLDNLLVVQADLTGGPTFRSALERTARRLRAASAHRQLPFSRLLETLPAHRDPRRMPLCDACFRVRERHPPVLRLAGAEVRAEPVDPGWVLHDLALTVDHVHPAVAGALDYRASMFDESTARAILGHLHSLLSAALAAPDTPVEALPMETPAQTRAALAEADRRAAAAAPPPVTESVRGLAARQPDAVAVSWPAGPVSYRELHERAGAIAAALRATGDVEDRPVVVRMPPGPRQIAALLGVLAAGGRLVWLGADDAGERGDAVLSDLRPACMVVDGEREADPLTYFYRRRLAGRVLDLAGTDLAAAAAPPVPPAGDLLPRSAYVAYTSGSTGRPKGIVQSHAALAQFVGWLGPGLGVGPGSRVAQWVAPEHDPALCEVFAALVAGATLCPVPEKIRANPEKFVDWLAAEQITFVQLVPSFARELLRVVTAGFPAERLAGLDRLVLMGEAVPAELVNGLRAALPLTRLVNVYGPTETVAATWYEIAGPVHGTIPIGRPVPGRLVAVLDDQDRPCPPGVTGNLVVHSRYVTPGYLGPASAERAPFRPLPELPGVDAGQGRTYRTGDLGRRRWDGELEYRGRRDHQVKIHGIRLELTDLEAALSDHPTVAECAVVPVTDRDGLVARLVAYVVPRRTAGDGPAGDGPAAGRDGPAAGEGAGAVDAWRAHLRHRFGRSMMPVLFKVLDGRLPRTVAGKVDRRRLPAIRPRPTRDARPPRGGTERAVVAIWAELLGGAPPRMSDDFFEAGGHSLLVPVLLHRVREQLRVEVPVPGFLADPSPAGLSALVESTPHGPGGAPPPAHPDRVPTGQRV